VNATKDGAAFFADPMVKDGAPGVSQELHGQGAPPPLVKSDPSPPAVELAEPAP